MSVDKPPLETHPTMDIVTDDVILPVTETSVLGRTKEQYAAMGADQ